MNVGKMEHFHNSPRVIGEYAVAALQWLACIAHEFIRDFPAMQAGGWSTVRLCCSRSRLKRTGFTPVKEAATEMSDWSLRRRNESQDLAHSTQRCSCRRDFASPKNRYPALCERLSRKRYPIHRNHDGIRPSRIFSAFHEAAGNRSGYVRG